MGSKSSRPTKTDKAQSDSFIKAARELGCDENEAAFDEKLKKVAAHKAKVSAQPDKARLLIELLKKIPRKEDGWPAPQRVRWFRTFAMNVSQIYDEDENPVELEIKAQEAAN